MGVTSNYEGFGKEVMSCFRDLIEEFNLQVTSPYEDVYLLTGKACVLRFTYYLGQVGCAFKQIDDDNLNPGYEVWSVYRQLFPIIQDIVKNFNKEWGTSEQQLKGFSEAIANKLKFILQGDFSWLPEYFKNQDREERLFSFVFNLNRNHPISKKFWSGDASYMEDAEKLLKEGPVTYSNDSILKKLMDKIKWLIG